MADGDVREGGVTELDQREQGDWVAIASELQKEKDHGKIIDLARELHRALRAVGQPRREADSDRE
jgi:hypothetical protein